MCVSAIRALGAAGLAAALSSAASGQDGEAPPQPLPYESLMTEAELLEAFSGRSVGGCYPDGSPVHERTAEDGALYDLLAGGALVGDWWVEGREICYRYTGDHGHVEGTFCWNVVRRSGDMLFFLAENGAYGGSSSCPDLVS